MSETDTRQALLDEALRLLDEQRAHFVGLNGPQRAIESEHWFRNEIRKALAPWIARVAQLEAKPIPTTTTLTPSRKWEESLFRKIEQHIKDEIKKRDQRIEMLERKLDDFEMKQSQFRYAGVWNPEAIYFQGNFVTEGGSLWHAHRETTQRPGDSPDWQLCVQRGKNGRDADGVRRLPTVQRSYPVASP